MAFEFRSIIRIPDMSASRSTRLAGLFTLSSLSLLLSSCAFQSAKNDHANVMQVSVPAQKMALYREGKLVKTYPVSTSKFGLGNEKGSYRTPLGEMEVAEKIGCGKPAGAVFKSRKWTGEVIRPNAPGRDPIVSRILWLNGLEPRNSNTYSRCIYIHGTAAERDIGRPVSYGCVRMKSRDVIDLYNRVGEGAKVFILRKNLEAPVEPGVEEMQIRALPVNDPAEVPLALRPVPPTATRPIWNEVRPFTSGVEVLEAEGYNGDYLRMPSAGELGLDG